jgi:serine/threonine-protein kinase
MVALDSDHVSQTLYCTSCGKQFREDVIARSCPDDGCALLPSANKPLFELIRPSYEVLSVIGSGGWSTVFRARQVALGQEVAIKVLHRHLAADSQMLKRFELEAETVSRLSHPNIVGIIDYGTTPQPYMVMEFIDGSSLADELKSQRVFSEQEVIDIGLQVSSALAAAHERGIIHRDIKPSNITIKKAATGSISAKVLDFGLSKLIEGEAGQGNAITRSGEALGSPPYMSPEQWSGADVDARSDIYSVGCMLYELITGRQAFSGASVAECMHKHLTEFPESIVAIKPNLPEGESVDRIVFQAIRKKQIDRYQSINDLIVDLKLARAAEPLKYASRRRYSLREWLQWKRKLLLRVLAGCLVLCLTGFWLLYLNRATLLDAIWNFNYKGGQQALAAKDYKLAGARFSTALKVSQFVGKKDKRFYWTLAGLAQALEPSQQWQELYGIKQQMTDLSEGDEHFKASLNDARTQYFNGNFPLALQLCNACIDQAKKNSSERNPAFASALGLQGMILTQLGRNDSAESALKEGVSIRSEWMGPNDPLGLEFQKNLGRVYAAMGRYSEARTVYERVLEAQKVMSGEGSLAVATTLSNLGGICHDAGDDAHSEQFSKQAVAIFEKIVGAERALSGTLNNLGEVYLAQRKLADAEQAFKRALQISEEFYGPDHPDTARMMDNMGRLYEAEGKLSKALPYVSRALKVKLEKLGPKHPSTLASQAEYKRIVDRMRRDH